MHLYHYDMQKFYGPSKVHIHSFILEDSLLLLGLCMYANLKRYLESVGIKRCLTLKRVAWLVEMDFLSETTPVLGST